MEREKIERERERERERDGVQEFWIHFNIFCVINVKYNEISWRVRRRRKKVTSRSTKREREKKNNFEF